MNKFSSKLLSHRMRGLAQFEHSRQCFEDMGSLQIKYFELDTRVCQDSVIYVHHNESFKVGGQRIRISLRSSTEIRMQPPDQGEHLLLLSDALKLFGEYSSPDQRLCIDIKDSGFEKEHLDLVKDNGLEQQVIFITWIPQTIISLYTLGAPTPLILSCWNINRLNLLGRLASHWVSGWLKNFGEYVVIGQNRITDELKDLAVGYQHALVCTEIPSSLQSILTNSGGGICIHKSMFCKRVGKYCRDYNLQLWLYNENTAERFKRLAENDDVHVIFSDVAKKLSLGS